MQEDAEKSVKSDAARNRHHTVFAKRRVELFQHMNPTHTARLPPAVARQLAVAVQVHSEELTPARSPFRGCRLSISLHALFGQLQETLC